MNWDLLSGLCQWVWIEFALLIPDCSIRTTNRYMATWICYDIAEARTFMPSGFRNWWIDWEALNLQQIKGATPTVPYSWDFHRWSPSGGHQFPWHQPFPPPSPAVVHHFQRSWSSGKFFMGKPSNPWVWKVLGSFISRNTGIDPLGTDPTHVLNRPFNIKHSTVRIHKFGRDGQ